MQRFLVLRRHLHIDGYARRSFYVFLRVDRYLAIHTSSYIRRGLLVSVGVLDELRRIKRVFHFFRYLSVRWCILLYDA